MRDLIESRKFRTMAMGILAVVIVKVAALKGVVLDAATADYLANAILGLAGAYIVAQGAADFGKEGKAADLLGKLDGDSLKKLLGGAAAVAKAVSADEPPSDAPESAPAAEEAPKEPKEDASDAQ